MVFCVLDLWVTGVLSVGLCTGEMQSCSLLGFQLHEVAGAVANSCKVK